MTKEQAIEDMKNYITKEQAIEDLKNYIIDSDNEYEDFVEFVESGGKPEDHIYYSACVVDDTVEELIEQFKQNT